MIVKEFESLNCSVNDEARQDTKCNMQMLYSTNHSNVKYVGFTSVFDTGLQVVQALSEHYFDIWTDQLHKQFCSNVCYDALHLCMLTHLISLIAWRKHVKYCFFFFGQKVACQMP